jgi:hypothetical protein
MSGVIKLLIYSVLFLSIVGTAQAFSDMASAPSKAPEAPQVSGTVVETMNAGGYTYVRIENEGMEAWAAVPETQVMVGEKVGVAKGMVMTNFTSKSLDRTFRAILFSQRIIRL